MALRRRQCWALPMPERDGDARPIAVQSGQEGHFGGDLVTVSTHGHPLPSSESSRSISRRARQRGRPDHSGATRSRERDPRPTGWPCVGGCLARGWPAKARCRGDIPAWKLSFRSMSTSPISWDGRMWLCCATTAGSPLTARTCRCQFRPRMRWPRCGVCARSSAPCRRACGASARVRGRHRWRP
jgi:hypothetical protein